MAEPTWTPGVVVWRELMTPDSKRAQGFYGELFGWKFETVPMGDGKEYTMASAGGAPICGMMQMEKGAPFPPNWTSYVSTTDVDATVEKAKKAGGNVLVPPMDVPGMGRFAILSDADGAPFAVWRSAGGDTPQTERPGLGTFCWETISAKSTDSAKKFYPAVFGWKVVPGPGGGIDVFAAGEQQVADLQPAQNMPPCWMTYVVVDTIASANARVEKLGGKVVVPLIPVPEVGNISLVTDPSGAFLGLFEPPKN